MKPVAYLSLLVLPALFLMTRGLPAAEPRPLLTVLTESGEIAGWKSFHEGKDVKTRDVWTLGKDGILDCKGSPKGYLYTEKDYGDFVLTLEYRWGPNKKPGNGGVLLRMRGPNRIWPKSLEAQINVDNAGDFWGLAGYSLDGPAGRLKRVEHPQFGALVNLKKAKAAEKPPGEWNHYKIIADGSTVTLVLNGEEVNRATHCDPTPGKILLTAEGDAIQFRNVRISP